MGFIRRNFKYIFIQIGGKAMNFLMGTLCGGVMEIEFPYFHPPYMIIEAENRKDAINLYNNKVHGYFDGGVMAVISNGKLKNISEYISSTEANIIYNEIINMKKKKFTIEMFNKFKIFVSSVASKYGYELVYSNKENYLLTFFSRHFEKYISIYASTRTVAIKFGREPKYLRNVSDEKLEEIFKDVFSFY